MAKVRNEMCDNKSEVVKYHLSTLLSTFDQKILGSVAEYSITEIQQMNLQDLLEMFSSVDHVDGKVIMRCLLLGCKCQQSFLYEEYSDCEEHMKTHLAAHVQDLGRKLSRNPRFYGKLKLHRNHKETFNGMRNTLHEEKKADELKNGMKSQSKSCRSVESSPAVREVSAKKILDKTTEDTIPASDAFPCECEKNFKDICSCKQALLDAVSLQRIVLRKDEDVGIKVSCIHRIQPPLITRLQRRKAMYCKYQASINSPRSQKRINVLSPSKYFAALHHKSRDAVSRSKLIVKFKHHAKKASCKTSCRKGRYNLSKAAFAFNKGPITPKSNLVTKMSMSKKTQHYNPVGEVMRMPLENMLELYEKSNSKNGGDMEKANEEQLPHAPLSELPEDMKTEPVWDFAETSFPVKGRTFQNLKLLNRKEVNVTDQFDCSASSSSEERDENAEVDVTALSDSEDERLLPPICSVKCNSTQIFESNIKQENEVNTSRLLQKNPLLHGIVNDHSYAQNMTGGKRVFESYRDISIEEEELGDVGGLTEEERKIRKVALSLLKSMKYGEHVTNPVNSTNLSGNITDNVNFDSDKLSCKICRKTFTATNSLYYHYRSHAGVKPYKCDICAKTFTRLHSLNYHKMIHNNTTRFICPYCKRGFRHPSHYKEHLNKHTGEEPYQCSECGRRFKTSNTHRRHMKLKHKISLDHRRAKRILPKSLISMRSDSLLIPTLHSNSSIQTFTSVLRFSNQIKTTSFEEANVQMLDSSITLASQSPPLPESPPVPIAIPVNSFTFPTDKAVKFVLFQRNKLSRLTYSG